MNQKKLTAGIAAVVLVFFIIAGVMEKRETAEEPRIDRTLEISDRALEGLLPENKIKSQSQSQKSFFQENGAQEPLSKKEKQSEEQPMEKAQQLSATLHTEKGDIVIELYADKTPKTVENFVKLAKKDFYNGTVFHRAIKGFMIQGGDPKGDGTGGPGYTFDDEPFDGEYTRGTVAMANAGPNTNGSQFFIMHADYQLPKNYVIFGKVIKGMDVIDQIASAPTTFSASGENSKPVSPVKVKTVGIANHR